MSLKNVNDRVAILCMNDEGYTLYDKGTILQINGNRFKIKRESDGKIKEYEDTPYQIIKPIKDDETHWRRLSYPSNETLCGIDSNKYYVDITVKWLREVTCEKCKREIVKILGIKTEKTNPKGDDNIWKLK